MYVDGGKDRVAVVCPILSHAQVINHIEYSYLLSPPFTNNESEYLAVIAALLWADKEKHRDVSLFSDSQLVVMQLKGEYRVTKSRLMALWGLTEFLLKGFSSWSTSWIPREKNLAGLLLEGKKVL